ncbi:hypothetical protein G647_06026 [Cladophialophora carrionii CBS 160.54]|uniref:Myb-like domain-containing protein n=1 Tax=Cladophialophora carrionii CBS 160.54 TaxID=1279043 RepID=V9D5N7_9EURO|nr:uncharacterized protein G647_06026 [Cladophialophora carrionii CBS 160.54]ETI21956.1 hypothetical protein G647_06026 [Cladophialophora carrionii CBS 160.54]
MPMVWNDEADARLFTAVLATTDVKIDWKAVAALMGPECTPKALTHRITTIKKKAGILSNGSSTATPASATPAAPVSGKPANPRKRAAKSDATANADSSVKGAMEDDADDGAPTAKKGKTKDTRKGFKKCAPAAPDMTPGEESKNVKCESDCEGDSDGVQE